MPGIGEVKTGGKERLAHHAQPLQIHQAWSVRHGGTRAVTALGDCVDDMCFVRSLTCDSNSHTPAMFQMNTGSIQQGFPFAGRLVALWFG